MFKVKGREILTIPKNINKKIIFFDWCGDIHPVPPSEYPIFKNAETIILTNCNKNFLYYWLRPEIFPKLKTIYTDELCQGEIFRFKNVTVYCSSDFRNKEQKQFGATWYAGSDVKLMHIDDKHLRTFAQIANNINIE